MRNKMMEQRKRRRRHTWIYFVVAAAGVLFFALGVWVAWQDGIPTWKRGEQPIEVLLLTGAGFFTFLSGVAGIHRAYKE